MAVVLFAIAIVAVIFHFVLGGDSTFLSRLIVVGGLAAPAGSGFWLSSVRDHQRAVKGEE